MDGGDGRQGLLDGGGLRRGWFERWKGDSEGVRCASAALFRKEATQKVFAGRNFTSKPLDTPGLGTLSFTVDRSHRAERYDICQKIQPLPQPTPTHLNPPHPVYRRGEDEGGAAKGSAGYLGLSHANNISPTSFSTSSYFSLPLSTVFNVKF